MTASDKADKAPARLPLRLAGYNVRRLRDDVRAVVTVVCAIAPDVLVVQEAPRLWFRRRRGAALAAACGMRIVAGGSYRGWGNLILAGPRVTVRQTQTVWLPPLRFLQPRTAVLASCVVRDVGLSEAQFTVVGTHLSTVATERGGQIDALARAAQEFVGVGGAVAVVGDFNEAPGGVVWQRLAALGLADAGSADPTPTFSTATPRRRIDAIFCSDGVEHGEYRVWHTGEVRSGSDHFPIVAQLRLTESARA